MGNDLIEFALFSVLAAALIGLHRRAVRGKEQESRRNRSLLADLGYREQVLLYYANIRGVTEYRELIKHLREFLTSEELLPAPWLIEVQGMDGRSPFFLLSSNDYEELLSTGMLPEMTEHNVEIYERNTHVATVRFVFTEIPEEESKLLALYSLGSVVYHTAHKAKSATRDTLTGLCTGAHFDHLLETELERSRRYGHPLSVIFMDMDGFKDINDKYDHHEGDKVLKEIAAILERHHREPDTLARRSGDEFLVLLPETDGTSCVVAAETLREALANHIFLGPDGSTNLITASVGIASFPESGETQEELLRTADEAMYQAKNSGGNRVVSGT